MLPLHHDSESGKLVPGYWFNRDHGITPHYKLWQRVRAAGYPNEKARCLRHTGPETPSQGCRWPGVTSARDRARASSPTDRRIASLSGNLSSDAHSRRTWATSVHGVSQAESTRDCHHGASVVLYVKRRVTPRGCSRDFDEILRLLTGIPLHIVSRDGAVGVPDWLGPGMLLGDDH